MASSATLGSEIAEITTEHIGFKSFSQGKQAPKKLKLLPRPWPVDQLPPPSASLFTIASRSGQIAAGGPGTLVLSSTERVRKAYADQANEEDVVDFVPDVTVDLPNLRHIAFSSGGDFLVVSAEDKGGLAVFDPTMLAKGSKEPMNQLPTDQTALKMLLPNPVPDLEQYMAVVLDTGKLSIVDIAEGGVKIMMDHNVTCAAWSTRGRAVAAGTADGTVRIFKTDQTLLGIIPRPPKVSTEYEVAGICWIETYELLLVYAPKEGSQVDPPDNLYHFVKCSKTWAEFEFRTLPYEPLLAAMDAPLRSGSARFSALRLRDWRPDLDNMLIITNSHTDVITLLTASSNKIAPEQENLNEYVLTNLDDAKKPAVPRRVFGEDGDSLLIGESLDLSATEKILRPVPALGEIDEAPWPLPAYMALTHQGILGAWWVIWNRSVEAGTRYPGLIFGSNETQASTQASTPKSCVPQAGEAQHSASTPFGRGTFGAAASAFGSTTPAFVQPSQPAFGKSLFGKPSQPAFGSPGFGSSATNAIKPLQSTSLGSPGFGIPSTIASSFGKPSQPAFGSTSTIGGSAFGAAGAPGNKQSPWGAQTQTTPFSSNTNQSSGFSKFNQTGGTSGFSSFASNSGTQSGFGSLSQSQSKSGFAGLTTEPSFGSTVTVNSGAGSTLPSWTNTPAQQASHLFGQSGSSFNTSSFESTNSNMSGTDDAPGRKRDEVTPTPQLPPQQSQGLFGLAGGFKLGTTFSSDGSAKDDPAKPAAPAAGSFFGSDFSSSLVDRNSKPPATPSKVKSTPSIGNTSTTPASFPSKENSFLSSTPAKESATPKTAPPVKSATPTVDDAPLPPDFINPQTFKSALDDLPPLAGSPGVEVEAPSSDIEVAPLDDEDGDDEDSSRDRGDEEVEDGTITKNSQKSEVEAGDGWTLKDNTQAPSAIFPPAPTPPVVKPRATSQSDRSTSPTQGPLFGQQPRSTSGLATKPGGSTLFHQQPQSSSSILHQSDKFKPADTPAAPLFGQSRVVAPIRQRSRSPLKYATAAPPIQREPLTTAGTSLSASFQHSKTLTPQSETVELEDEEDERMWEQLQQPIVPSRALDDFIAHQDYTGKTPSKTGEAAQIERLYKDISGMVDTLGWNARSIKSFIEYHKQAHDGHEVNREALEDDDDTETGLWFDRWSICEIQGLKALEDDLEHELDTGRVQDVLVKLAQLARLLREKAILMTRLNEIRRDIISRKSSDQLEALRKAPLQKELSDGQKALRASYARMLVLLGEAEEANLLLRAHLASHDAQNGKSIKVPSMENVRRTVVKMANFAETRNNEILLLESQMQKLGVAGASSSRPSSSSSHTPTTPRRGRGTDLRKSIAESPFVTPPAMRTKVTLVELNRRATTFETSNTPNKGYGLHYTSRDTPSAGRELSGLSDFVDDHIESLKETERRRKEVAHTLKKALGDRGVRVTKVH